MKTVSSNRQVRLLLEKVAYAAALVAVVAFGLSRLLQALPEPVAAAPDEASENL